MEGETKRISKKNLTNLTAGAFGFFIGFVGGAYNKQLYDPNNNFELEAIRYYLAGSSIAGIFSYSKLGNSFLALQGSTSFLTASITGHLLGNLFQDYLIS